MGAQPIGRPGWPLLDLLMASTASIRMLLMQSVSRDAGAATMVLRGKVGAILTHCVSGKAQLAHLKARQTLWPPKPKELDKTVPSV